MKTRLESEVVKKRIQIIMETGVNRVEYRGSFPNIQTCPKDDRPEFALIGRSNVGKSSLVNMLCDRKDIAHTSKKPGKTQMLNFYLVDHRWYFVDLPGYGYAKVSKAQRKKWQKMIDDYLILRPNLQCAFVLIDINVPPQKIDIEFINRLGEHQVPFVIVYTKTDRLKPVELETNLEQFRQALLEHWNALPQEFITSSVKREGKEEILAFIEQITAQYEEYE